MSPAATRDIRAAGLQSSRHAAALSGNALPLGHRSGWSAPQGRDVAPRRGDIIRAGARIAAGALPVQSSGLRFDASLQLPAASVAGLFPLPLCGGPSSQGIRRAGGRRCSAQPPGAGRHPFHDALRYRVQPLETHHSRLQLVSRASALPGPSRRDLTSTFVSASFAHEGDRGRTPYDGNLTAKDGNVAH